MSGRRDFEDIKARVEAALADYKASWQAAVDWHRDYKIAHGLDTAPEPREQA